MRITEDEMERAKSPRGGWTRKQLAAWGVPWPPPKGWRKRLLGRPSGSFHKPEQSMGSARNLEAMMTKDETVAQLLRKVVVAIINKGHADDLYEFPDVLAYFGSRIPDEDEVDPAIGRSSAEVRISSNGLGRIGDYRWSQ